ncbi:phosphoglycolate phosphatase [Neorhizobium lilium]|uniref:Phosphoglycolate phosphatase n=1 Tax=Neorhizobium lilium TaxID=2503024 RepID=A0A3S3RGV8_9HYPH|nr:HAD family hydrolase [Neorhizobium lilium]RWX75516.1 phosphoglycolate phosphatase [Neorhizobium lilium]
MSNPLVIFDLDGTLIDTAPDLIDSLNHTITAVGLKPVSFGDLTYLVGQGVRVMIRRAFELRDTPLDEQMFEQLITRFMDHYASQMPGRSRPYPGALECLDRLAAAGLGMAVCTNKPEQLALLLMGKLGLTDRFAAITGGDTFPVRKPDARHILGTIDMALADPARSIMVGDSVNDILAAQNAGIASIAVSFGYSDVPVETLGPDHVIASYDELTPALVEQVLSRHSAKAALSK